MESTRSKSELMKPIFLKAGIPLALSLAGYIYTLITRRRKSLPEVSPVETQAGLPETDSQEEFQDQESFHSLDSTFISSREEEEQQITYTQTTDLSESLFIRDRPDLEEEILRLRRWVIALQDREKELEIRFLHYCGLKEQESVLMELRNMLVLEIARVEFMVMEVESMEAENRRLEAVVVEYLRVAEQLESARLENGLLQRKVKKLLRTTKERFRVVRQQASALQAREAEILRNQEELEQRAQIIKELEDETMELRKILGQLQEEKKELVEKLELAETLASSASKEEAKETENEDHDQLLTELEQLRKDRATEVEELIYLRWINACLRHELLKNQEQQSPHHEEKGEQLLLEFEGNEEKRDCGLEYDTDGSSTASEHRESCLGITTTGHPCSKRQRLIYKLKRWVEGSEKRRTSWDEDKHQNKGTRRSISDRGIEPYPPARKSCSSA